MIEEGEEVYHKTKGYCTVLAVQYHYSEFIGARLLVKSTQEIFFEDDKVMIKGA